MVKVVDTKSYENKEKGIIVVYVFDEYNNKFKGRAVCSPEDPYNYDFGEKLAYLKAKKKMVNFYKRANEKQLEITRKNMAAFEERMGRELDKHTNALNKIDEAINTMIQEENA